MNSRIITKEDLGKILELDEGKSLVSCGGIGLFLLRRTIPNEEVNLLLCDNPASYQLIPLGTKADEPERYKFEGKRIVVDSIEQGYSKHDRELMRAGL